MLQLKEELEVCCEIWQMLLRLVVVVVTICCGCVDNYCEFQGPLTVLIHPRLVKYVHVGQFIAISE